jgi:uncharacterized protein YceK
MMPTTEHTYPTRNEVIEYLSAYEQRYQFPTIRPVHVDHIEQKDGYLDVYAGDQYWRAKLWSVQQVHGVNLIFLMILDVKNLKEYSFIQRTMSMQTF